MNEHDPQNAEVHARLLTATPGHADERPLRPELYQSNRTDSNLIPEPLILASGSPRRVELLGELGVPFQTVVSGAPEIIDPGLTPEAQAVALAERKALAVASRRQEGIMLGADTIVVLGGELLGKPVDDADATRMLRRLSGEEHRVVTGVALVAAGTGSLRSSVVSSTVRFRPLSDEEIDRYVATGEPRGKAGAYAIQGIGAGLVATLEGCFTNVVGLPLCETARLLMDAGIAVSSTWPGCRLLDGAPCPRSV
ncbi:MAG TPA: Maf family protein [Thermomicrobiales bacterium]|nr:Maf family protein [Thermomicrobiales bacterium]